MHKLTTLIRLGFTPNEAQVYLAALRLDECLISDLAHDANLPRSTTAETLGALHKRGLMKYFLKHNRKHWYAENPSKLVSAFEEQKNLLSAIVPTLQKLRPTATTKPQINAHVGTHEISQILEDIVHTQHHVQALICWKDWSKLMETSLITEFNQRRKELNLQMRIITEKSEETENLRQKDHENFQLTRFLPETFNLKQVANFIYQNKSAFVSTNQHQPIGLVILDPYIAQMQAIYFNKLWEISR